MTSGVQIAAMRTGESYWLSVSADFLSHGALGIQFLSTAVQPVAATKTNAKSRILVVIGLSLVDRKRSDSGSERYRYCVLPDGAPKARRKGNTQDGLTAALVCGVGAEVRC